MMKRDGELGTDGWYFPFSVFPFASFYNPQIPAVYIQEATISLKLLFPCLNRVISACAPSSPNSGKTLLFVVVLSLHASHSSMVEILACWSFGPSHLSSRVRVGHTFL